MDLAYKIDRALSVYVEVIDPVVDNYVTQWQNKGYDEDSLLFIANYCFRKNKRSLEDMNDVVERMYKNGLVTTVSIAEYIRTVGADDAFVKEILSLCGLTRRPTDWDRENLRTWRGWNFSDDMISEAAKYSNGKNNPISYINAVLSGWKSEGIMTADKIPQYKKEKTNRSSAFETRKYTEDELNELIDNIDDIEF